MEDLSHELVLLCEGRADREFFRKLIENRKLPGFSIPFPTDKLHGNSAFTGMLEAISGAGRNFQRIRGVLVVADSTDEPSVVFKSIAKQIANAKGFPVPAEPDVAAPGSEDFPATQISLLPSSTTPGGLESLLVKEIAAKRPDALTCVNEFLRCGKIDAHQWPLEKRDKAILNCLVAAINKDDPTRAASWLFKDPTPVISLTAECFDPVAQLLIEFSNTARRE